MADKFMHISTDYTQNYSSIDLMSGLNDTQWTNYQNTTKVRNVLSHKIKKTIL